MVDLEKIVQEFSLHFDTNKTLQKTQNIFTGFRRLEKQAQRTRGVIKKFEKFSIKNKFNRQHQQELNKFRELKRIKPTPVNGKTINNIKKPAGALGTGIQDALRKTNFTDVNKNIQKVGKNIQFSTKKSIGFNKALDKVTQKGRMDRFTESWNKSAKGVLKFNGNLLGMLFFGMQMKRIFTSALSSIFEGYKKIIPENSKFNTDMTKLNAKWEFFKFQLADAFARSDVFTTLINGASKLLNWFNKLNPTTQKFITISLGLGAALGFIIMSVGALGLGLSSIYNILKGGKLLAQLGKLLVQLKKIAFYDLSKLNGGFKKLGTKIGNISFKSIKNGLRSMVVIGKEKLKTLGAAFTKFARTPIGVGTIIGAALIAGYKISEWGLKQHNLKSKGLWQSFAIMGIDALLGIIGVVLLIPLAFKNVLKTLISMFKDAAQVLSEIWNDVLHLNFKDAMKRGLNFSSKMAKNFVDNMVSDYAKMGNIALELKKKMNLVEPIEESNKSLNNLNSNYKDFLVDGQPNVNKATDTLRKSGTGSSNQVNNNTTNVFIDGNMQTLTDETRIVGGLFKDGLTSNGYI